MRIKIDIGVMSALYMVVMILIPVVRYVLAIMLAVNVLRFMGVGV